MSTKIRFLGFGAFHITASDGTDILIDPYLDNSPKCPVKSGDFKKVDLILVSHAAFDHIGETGKIAKQYGCPVICGGDSKLLLLEQGVPQAQLIETVWGLMVKAAGIRVRPVKSEHRSGTKLADGRFVSAIPLGFMIYMPDNMVIYNASDTALYSDIKLLGELYKPRVGLINVTIENCFSFLPEFLTGEMTAYEAALCAKWMGVEYAVACHYTTKNQDVKEFCDLLNQWKQEGSSPCTPIAPEVGDTITID